MKLYDMVYSRLEEFGFVTVFHEAMRNVGMASLRRGDVHVALQEWELGMNRESVQKDCQFFRETLLQAQQNLWNAYYILCANDDQTLDEVFAYAVERDAASIRKYVIRFESDLMRVPFLDNPSDVQQGTDNSLFATFDYEDDVYVTKLLTYLETQNAGINKLNQQELDKVVNRVLDVTEVDSDVD